MKTLATDQPSCSTDFRCTRNTNDLRGWMETCIIPCSVPLWYLLYLDFYDVDLPIAASILIAFVALSAFVMVPVLFVCQLRELIFPRELELVVNDVEIRWSRMNRSNGQETLSLENVKYLVVGRAERTVSANTGGYIHRMIGQYIFTKASFAAFLKFMADRHPEIRIVDGDGHLAADTETSH